MLIDLHTHTIASGHGTTNTINDMAKEASLRHLQTLGISDHAPAIPGAAKASYFRSLKYAPKKRFSTSILFGTEANIIRYDGTLDLDQYTLSCLDYGIASLHTPCLPPGTKEENTKCYINAMKNPYITIIGHPDDSRYILDYKELVKAAKEHHVILEVNESSLSPSGYRGNSISCYQTLLPLCIYYQVPILIGSDSHGTQHIGECDHAKKLLTALHFPSELILNQHPQKLKSYLNIQI